MEKRSGWRLYVNKKDENESYFLQDRCVQGEYQKGHTIKYGFYGDYVDIELHKNLYLAATFNNEDVIDSVNLDTLHGENRIENFYCKYRNHHAILIMLKNLLCILMETNDGEIFHNGKVLASKKAIKKALEDLETNVTIRDVFLS